jgi:hypothetical protein
MQKGEMLRVSEVVAKYPLTLWAIYQAIRNDPVFPVINIGPVKNYRINEPKLKIWLLRSRGKTPSAHIAIPSAHELLERRR